MTNDFDYDYNDNEDYLLTDQESRRGLRSATSMGLYALLLLVVIITAAHGIMLVLHESTAYDLGVGLFARTLNAVRIAFPITVEVAAVVAGLGFISSQWRKSQKAVGLGIELVWIVFAAANMITMFRIERGLVLETWQTGWVDYGLPLSALIAGILVYGLKRADPDHKRAAEVSAAVEKMRAQEFTLKREVALSPQMRQIERQRIYMNFVNQLRLSGRYTESQIEFILRDTPELLTDKNHNGVVDLLEDGAEQPAFPDRTRPGRIVSEDDITEWQDRTRVPMSTPNGRNPQRPT